MKRFVSRPGFRWAFLSFFGFLLLVCFLSAEIRLPSIIGDNMVFQQGQPLKIWGWAEPGEKISVALAGQKGQAITDAKGRWQVILKPMKSGQGSLRMTVSGTKRRCRLCYQ
jgi:sialate O-acetylesterase